MPSDPYEEVVNRVILLLREERKKQAISQESLAKIAGLSRTGIRHMEDGEVMPTLRSLLKIAAALKVSLPKLICEAETRGID